MDILMEVLLEQVLFYGGTAVVCGLIIYYYLKGQKKTSLKTERKIEVAKQEGRFEPVSLHPYIDLDTCIGSGACVAACPEKDILGLINGKVSVINASNCVGHGACFHACPVEAISLRIGTESRGVELPHVNQNFETNIQGIFIAGELGGMGLIKNSVEQGKQAIENVLKRKWTKLNDVKDVIIIGAGPAGISASLTAKKHNLDCLTLEQYTLGGTVYSFPRAKIVMTSPMDLPLHGKVKLFDTSKDELLTLWNQALDNNEIKIVENTKVESIIPQPNGTFKLVIKGGKELFAHNVLIAIGRRGTPRKLNVPGEDLEKVSYKVLEPEMISEKNIMVVGGGDSAIESAMLLMDLNKVTLSYRKDSFSRLKPKNRERIDEAIEQKKLEVIYNSNLISINQDHVLLKVIEETDTRIIPNDLVFIFAGGELPTKFLMNAGVEITKRFGYIVKKHA
jgi:thioredoxin reductase/NAD-dependent dihydropyrimidine dehydrogenase PreA subunit